MRAVWSFWSRPFLAHKGTAWAKPLYHLLAWRLSVSAASRHYPETMLITDAFGKKLLFDTLGLPFVSVSTELERLNDVDPDWWALGKLVAYSMQDQPFIHIDTDVFLWKALPPGVAQAAVFAQCPEYFHRNSGRGHQSIEASFRACNRELPMEWEWAESRDDTYIREENCGILGGCRVDFLRHYAQTAVDLIMKPEYSGAWSRTPVKCNLAVEQFFLSACLDFHRFRPDSPYRGVRIQYLFPSWEDALNPNSSARAGFTHLLSDAKTNLTAGRRIEERVRREDPGYVRRCEKVLERMV
jgi:hypothetical protein